jgi:Domain of unknown function (DUF4145)
MKSNPLLRICPHCGNRTPHEERFRHSFESTWYGPDGKPTADEGPPIHYRLFECQTCGDIVLYQGLDNEADTETVVYPDRVTLDTSVPKTVASNYNEAKRIRQISPNAFAVLIRRALEAMCDDRGTKPGVLQKRLAELSQRGEIPPKLSEMTSVLRELGNAGAHNSQQSVTVPQTWAMDQFFQTVIEYVYVAPSKLEEFKNSLKKTSKVP